MSEGTWHLLEHLLLSGTGFALGFAARALAAKVRWTWRGPTHH